MVLGFVLGLVSSPPIAAQAMPGPDPAPASIDSIFARFDRTTGPGCALGVYRSGRIHYARGYGMADLNHGLAIQPSTVFYIASTSKQFTAASVALAAESGRLNLDDPITRHIPELPQYADRITIRQLIQHTSGLRDYLGLWGMSGRSFADEIPEDVALDLVTRQMAADFPAGSRWSYSNTGYFLLSVVIKRATGMSLREFAERNVFRPLGMTSTHFHDDNRLVVPRRAEGYQPRGGGFEIVRTSFALVGDGGLYTTIEDLAKWDHNFSANRLGGRGQGLIDELTASGTLTGGERHGYGFGLFAREYRGQPVIDHGGAFIGFRAQLLRFPTQRFSVAVLCNDYTADAGALAERVADRYLASQLSPADAGPKAVAVRVRPDLLARYEGRYEVLPGQVVAIRRIGSDLQATAFGQTATLIATSDSQFVAHPLPGQLEFRPGPSGIGLLAHGIGPDPVPQLKPAPTLDAVALRAFTGRFVSEELDTWATISVVDNALWIRARYDVWSVLEPISPDVFAGRGTRIEFVRHQRGGVVGFRLSAARSANIEFARTIRPLRWSPLDRPGLAATSTRP